MRTWARSRWAYAGIGCMSLVAATFAAEQPADPERFAAPPPSQDEVFLQLADPLGNPRRYCMDIPGFGMIASGLEGWLTSWPLETHTCKTQIPRAHYFFVDQLVSREALLKPVGQIRFSRFDRCAEIMRIGGGAASGVREDSWVLLAPCSDSERQQFVLEASGEIRPVLDPKKCLTVGTEAHEAGNRAPNEPWYQRALTVSTCAKAEMERQKWRISTPPADPS